MTNAVMVSEVNGFEACDWAYLVGECANVFRMNEFEKTQLEQSVTARIIAELPFVVGCENAERTAIAHL